MPLSTCIRFATYVITFNRYNSPSDKTLLRDKYLMMSVWVSRRFSKPSLSIQHLCFQVWSVILQSVHDDKRIRLVAHRLERSACNVESTGSNRVRDSSFYSRNKFSAHNGSAIPLHLGVSSVLRLRMKGDAKARLYLLYCLHKWNNEIC